MVQIKSVSSDNSYIRNEKTNSFEFYPRKEDIQYWEKYKKNGIEVLLVIYDQRIDALYCKKVIDTDLFIGKENLKPGKKKNTNAITFHGKILENKYLSYIGKIYLMAFTFIT